MFAEQPMEQIKQKIKDMDTKADKSFTLSQCADLFVSQQLLVEKRKDDEAMKKLMDEDRPAKFDSAIEQLHMLNS